MSCYIVASAASLPSRVVTNAELAPLLGVSAEWIEDNSGIRERRWVESEQTTSDLAAAAVRDALADATLRPDQLDYMIGCTLSPDYQVPGIAPLVQRKLDGWRMMPAVDLRVACTGILYSLQLGRALIESGAARNVVCFGAEAQSKGLDLKRRSAEPSMLFGDGAGALVLSGDAASGHAQSRPVLLVDDVLISTDGRFAEDLIVRSPGSGNGALWLDPAHLESGLARGFMNGRSVILQAVRKLSEAALEIATRNDIALDQIDIVIPHQANANLLAALAKKLSIPEERMVINVDRFGNTSSASAFIALWQAYREDRILPHMRMLILAFGAGFTWGAALCRAV